MFKRPRACSLKTALVALAFSGCTHIPLKVEPPPRIPGVVDVPQEPELRTQPSEFSPHVDQKAVGDSRLKLRSRAVGLAPIPAVGAIDELPIHLMSAMLEAGFDKVLDLSPGRYVSATWASQGKADQVRLYGNMAQLMRIAKVSQAQVVVAGEVLRAETVQRPLPVRFWYDDAPIADYSREYTAYSAARANRVSEIDSIEAGYSQKYREAEAAYDEAIKPWQRAMDKVVPPEARVAYQEFRDTADSRRAAMPDTVSSADTLRREAEARRETRKVEVSVGEARFQVLDPASGELLAIITVSAEGRNPEELTINLARAAAAALGDR
jgi:hypothetical protein